MSTSSQNYVDENSHMNWRLDQLYVDININKYNIDL